MSLPVVNQYSECNTLNSVPVYHELIQFLNSGDVSNSPLWSGLNSNMLWFNMTPSDKLPRGSTSMPYLIIQVPDKWIKFIFASQSTSSFFSLTTNPNNINELEVPLCTAFSAVELSMNISISNLFSPSISFFISSRVSTKFSNCLKSTLVFFVLPPNYICKVCYPLRLSMMTQIQYQIYLQIHTVLLQFLPPNKPLNRLFTFY